MGFALDLEWPQGGPHEHSEVADVRLSVRDHVLTRLYDVVENSGRDHFRASAVRLAFWFADNWWRLRWEPIDDIRSPSPDWRLAHELSSGAGDEAWPPLMIYGVGPRVIVSPSPGRADDEVVRYLLDRPVPVVAEDYEQGVDELLDRVLDRCARHHDAQPLRALVDQLGRERSDEELAGWRRLEACLGYNPDRAPDQVIEAMVAFEERLGAASVDEAAIAHPGASAPAALRAAVQAADASSVLLDFSDVVSPGANVARASSAPWAAAEDAAYDLRRRLGLGEVVSGHDLGGMLRIRWDTLKTATATARGLPFGAALMDDVGEPSGRAALQFVGQIDRRFEVARLIGDILWTRGTPLGVVSKAKTDRQKFQRAFAQTLLCPIGGLRNWIDLDRPAETDIDRAARHFAVRPAVVRTMLVNKGYLARETLADRLEDA